MAQLWYLLMFNPLLPRGRRLKTQKYMIRNLSKAQAYMNAQAVMSMAVFFGHGDVVTMSVGSSCIALTLTFDRDYYVESREKEWLSELVVCGVDISVDESIETDVIRLYVLWSFNLGLL